MNLDDAAFYFGKENDWLMKIGRFEAYDMFPLNQDTFVEYSGNTANDLYSDGYGYIYMMKEARGRSNSGGNLLVSKTLDNWYLELNTLVEDGSSLFVEQRYHGEKLDNKKNVVYFRPVVSWRSSNYSLLQQWKLTRLIMRMGTLIVRGVGTIHLKELAMV